MEREAKRRKFEEGVMKNRCHEEENKKLRKQRLQKEADFEAWSKEVLRRQWERYERFQEGTSEGSGMTSQQKEEAIRAVQSIIQKAEAQRQRREQ